MKNLLALALVATSAAALCADDNGSNGLSAWATGHVSVKIVPTLTIKEDKALNFGRVLQGTSGSININEKDGNVLTQGNVAVSPGLARGEFTVNAADKDEFQVQFENADVADNGFGGGKLIVLTNGVDTIEFDATLYCNYSSGTAGPKNEGWKVYVGGNLTIPVVTSVGTYKGTYKLIATYL